MCIYNIGIFYILYIESLSCYVIRNVENRTTELAMTATSHCAVLVVNPKYIALSQAHAVSLQIINEHRWLWLTISYTQDDYFSLQSWIKHTSLIEKFILLLILNLLLEIADISCCNLVSISYTIGDIKWKQVGILLRPCVLVPSVISMFLVLKWSFGHKHIRN